MCFIVDWKFFRAYITAVNQLKCFMKFILFSLFLSSICVLLKEEYLVGKILKVEQNYKIISLN